MKPILTCLLVLSCTMLPAQDVEPSLGRAARVLARTAAAELPFLGVAASALAVVAAPNADRAAVAQVTAALTAERFHVVDGAAESALVVEVSTVRREGVLLITLRVPASAWQAVCGAGNADWVDAPPGIDVMQAGPDRATPNEAVAAARDELARTCAARWPGVAADRRAAHLIDDMPARAFVAARGEGPSRTHHAVLRATPDRLELDRTEIRIERAVVARRTARGIAFAAAAALLTMAYLRADFATRGYRTGWLRLVFGSLLALVGCCLWGVAR